MTAMPPKIKLFSAERLAFQPKEDLTVSQFAAKYRVLTTGSMKGDWTNEVTPYAVQPMDDFSTPHIREIWLMFGPQSAKSQIAINCMHYAISQAPGACMYIMPDEKVSKRLSLRQLIPSFRMSKKLQHLLSPRADDTSTGYVKFKNGADLMMGWASSPAIMASESVCYMFFDEPGKYPSFSGKEADPFTLGEVRLNAFPHTSKKMAFSTPNEDGDLFSTGFFTSPDIIYRYKVKCPVCGHMQFMTDDRIVVPGNLKDHRIIRRKKLARYHCSHCPMEWTDFQKNTAVKNGYWVAGTCPKNTIESWKPLDEDIRPVATGYHLPSWYSPFVSLSDVVAARIKGENDPAKQMAYVTQHKAEPFKGVVEKKEESQILKLRNNLPARTVPQGAVALTAGIDMQKVGFWFVLRAWMPDLSSHLVEYSRISNWDDLKTLVFETRYTVDGTERTMGIWRAALDTGGGKQDEEIWSRTEEAYEFLRNHSGGVIFGTKGASRPQLHRVRTSVIDKMPRSNKPIPGGLELKLLDTVELKGLFHWRLSRTPEESQHITLNAETKSDYASQILAEELRKNRNGTRYWHQIRKDNHLLDCEMMAAACADGEWSPSLQHLARIQADSAEIPQKQTKTKKEETAPHNPNMRKRPGWYRRQK